MIELTARRRPRTDDAMEVTIELDGSLSDLEDELEAVLYHVYKQVRKDAGNKWACRMVAATRNALGRFYREVVCDGEL